MRRRIITGLLFAVPVLSAADFQDFQAARAVIGQPSFSAHEKGIEPRALSLARGNLYVADASGQMLTFDVSRIGSARTTACPVCLVTPQASIAQNVFEGIAASAGSGRNIVIADMKSHRVMLWRGVSPLEKPDVVLSGFLNPVSVAIDNQRLFVGDTGSHHVFIWNSLPTFDTQAPDVTLGPSEIGETAGPDTIQTPSALVSDGANLFVGDAASHRVLVFSTGDSAAPQVLNAATLLPGAVAPGTLLAIEHSRENTTVFLNGNPLRTTESEGQPIQIQVPYDLNSATAGSLWIKTELEGGLANVSRPVTLRFAAATPGIFAFGTTEPRTGLVLHAPAGVPLSPEDPAKAGDLLTVWATGLGAVNTEANEEGGFDTLIPVRAAINGSPIEVISATLPAEATGVYEVRLRLPAVLPASASLALLELVLLENDAKSNAVTFPLKK